MINNARVESDARSAHASEATPQAGESGEQDKQRTLQGLSVDSGSDGGYEEDIDSPDRLKSSNSIAATDTKARRESAAGLGFAYELRGKK